MQSEYEMSFQLKVVGNSQDGSDTHKQISRSYAKEIKQNSSYFQNCKTKTLFFFS